MSLQSERALVFKSLHEVGNPLVLFNIWDPGSAATVEAWTQQICPSVWI